MLPMTIVLVKQIPLQITLASLCQIFEPIGMIHRSVMLLSPDSTEKLAFIEYEDPDDAESGEKSCLCLDLSVSVDSLM